MNNEDFYKDTLIKLLNDGAIGHVWNSPIWNEIEIIWEDGKKIVDVKGKIPIKEKTWYRTRRGHNVYIYAILPGWTNLDYMVKGIEIINPRYSNQDESVNFTASGRFSTSDSDHPTDLCGLCTSQQVAEIEKQLKERSDNER